MKYLLWMIGIVWGGSALILIIFFSWESLMERRKSRGESELANSKNANAADVDRPSAENDAADSSDEQVEGGDSDVPSS